MKFYFAGSIVGGREDAELYKEIIEMLQPFGRVLTEHIGDVKMSDLGETELTPEAIFKRDVEYIKQCSYFVAEVTQVSMGVGYELAFAESLKKPVLCLFRPESGKRLSAMIRGNKNFKIVEYTETKELMKLFIKEFNNRG